MQFVCSASEGALAEDLVPFCNHSTNLLGTYEAPATMPAAEVQ